MVYLLNFFIKFTEISFFMIEILLALGLFVYKAERRTYFFPRVIVSVVICFLLSGLQFIFVEPRNILLMNITFVLTLALVVVSVWFSFRISFWAAMFYTIGASAMQHLANRVTVILKIAFQDTLSSQHQDIFLEPLIFIVVYIIIYIVLIHKILDCGQIDDKKIIITGVAMIFYANIYGYVFPTPFDAYKQLGNGFYLYATTGVLSCVFILSYMGGIFQQSRISSELECLQQLWDRERYQFDLLQENINTINIKCHDIRHLVRNYKADSIPSESLKEVVSAISIYDCMTKTGNHTLDIILMDKKLKCEANKIQFSTLAEGSLLDGMEPFDIYSLFENALENAMAYECTLLETDKRFIRIVLKKIEGFISICIENYFEGDLKLEGKLPKTTKKDKQNHGLGMKSISEIVKKYDGNMSLETQDSVFRLNIIIPITNSKYPCLLESNPLNAVTDRKV